ncbi:MULTISPECIES: CDP-glucose 4,6-dehydratase [Methylomonas]|uniref:CDP-glucose 4,6-dehydratase n=1 Tax=Methylomonas koyamae TaxID=702114 RepID=A0A291IM15_9GAMM|nr:MULTISPECIES: CDP-glucose 4,6-dehydratase [Methylomonas]ANE56388.1 CDP-glucose 4,6-dehydratase [Methylomonas sp. DH-1]ATG91319.1 CDP-glucose 4,6-dehydratase [Methylomonas koyamae]OAI21722.1 CDP-glucose 4,6-dehydratase [Methylomonas koyamae]
MNPEFWRGKRVFVTGHTGFKGAWLTMLLHSLGAEVYGYALPPATEPSLFEEAGVESLLAAHVLADIRDLPRLTAALDQARPDIVLHLAAQPLVRYSYREPVETFQVNVLGTVNLLEAVRRQSTVRAVVNVTTDKCYENREWLWPYRENEAMGGRDPYSASKGCAELVTAAYRASFLAQAGVHLASARAGNVIGGGDWAEDRLIPDALRALDRGEELVIRAPNATRPWQHVLEPLSGYLALAEHLFEHGESFAEGWNFGPREQDAKPVAWLLGELAKCFPALNWRSEPSDLHEAHFLSLDSSKARQRLDWQPRWRLRIAIEKTAAWHQAWRNGEDMAEFSAGQIRDYRQAPHGDGLGAI